MATHGGSRNRSGPPADPDSRNSARKGLRFNLLPAEGYRGKVPELTLPDRTLREAQVWVELWRTPQAQAWSTESWRWDTIAIYVRVKVRAEALDAPIGLYTQMTRLADQLGLTPAGLADNGWQVATDEVAAARARLEAAEQAIGDGDNETPDDSQPRERRGRRLRGA